MSPQEWIAFLESRIASREEMARFMGRPVSGKEPTASFVGTNARGIGVRPEIVDWHEGGRKTYILTYDQAKKCLKKAQEAIA